MRLRTLLFIALPLVSSAIRPLGVAAAPKESDAYHIVIPRHAVSAGERVELRLAPPAPKGLRVNWWVTSGTRGIGLSPPGIYRAPYVIPVGTPPANVSASFSGSGVRASVTTEIELTPSSMPGAAECLGPGQSFSTVLGDIEPGSTHADVPPELIHRVDPEYPRSAFARGIEDTIPVLALVCGSGRVLDAYVPPSYLDTRDQQPIVIERDPKLVESALVAVRQYIFRPATAAGQPIAVWVFILVAFRH